MLHEAAKVKRKVFAAICRNKKRGKHDVCLLEPKTKIYENL